MIEFAEMDDTVTLGEQTQEGGGPAILVNVLTVDPEEADRFLEVWAEDAAAMKRQPGFISTQLHRGIAGSGAFLNVAVWETVDDFRNAFRSKEFRANLEDYPPSASTSPHLFRRIAVPGICVA